MSTILRLKSMATTVCERQPCRAGSAAKEGRSRIVRSGDEGAKIVSRRPDQEVANEERMPGVFGEDADIDPIGRVGAAIKILREQIARRACARISA